VTRLDVEDVQVSIRRALQADAIDVGIEPIGRQRAVVTFFVRITAHHGTA
jgi:hypothetical protein